MSPIQYSSGNLVADRRAAYAAALAGDRAYADAAELMAQVLELVPDWTAGWDLLGEYRQKAGDAVGAIAAWGELAARDVAGVFGAGLKLAAHGDAVGAQPAPAYVEALFDDYAPRFEAALVTRLGYRVPAQLGALIRAAMAERGLARFERTLDLGCGTGLMGEAVRELTGTLVGVDLSQRMLAEARRKSIYDRLVRAELGAFLAAEGEPADLIVAADVFIYIGDLAGSLEAAQRVLVPGGLLAFSLETHGGDAPVVLGEALRFQHAPRAALELCAGLGLSVLSAEPTVIRQDRGADVPGLLVVAARD